MKTLTMVVLAGVLAAVAGGCGASGGGDTAPAESLSAADLKQGAAFWLELEPAQRRELAGVCRDKEIKAAPAELVTELQEFDIDDYVALVTKEYEEQGEDSASDIEEACEEAKVEIAREKFEQIEPHLREGAE